MALRAIIHPLILQLRSWSQRGQQIFSSGLRWSLQPKGSQLSVVIFLCLMGVCCFWYILPRPLFCTPYSLVLLDRDGRLLTARVATDGQYRFPLQDSVPFRYKACTLLFEDEYFYWHLGVNPVSIMKACFHNSQHQGRIRGASTLTMQLARLTHAGSPRTIPLKIKEILQALRIELTYSKERILCLYAAHAPFGGNVVGLETAAWRYYNCSSWQLSWGQMAALAVLPNAPSVVHPSKGREELQAKRNFLLAKLWHKGMIDSMEYALALEEPLPNPVSALPQWASHVADHMLNERDEYSHAIYTSLQWEIQKMAENIVHDAAKELAHNRVYNVAALIAEVQSGRVIAYVGNSPNLGAQHQGYVNNVKSLRSSASLLKPFLFAALLDEGRLFPHEMVPDIPTHYGDFNPSNASGDYTGAVSADEALIASLNIPYVYLLQKYGVKNFLTLLRNMGLRSFSQNEEYYGLSLILGGGECSLWDITGAYASMARTLNNYFITPPLENPIHPLTLYNQESKDTKSKLHAPHASLSPLGAGAIYCTLETLSQLNRPREESGWEYLFTTQRIAWKTGTSHGNKDAWAVGVTPEYAVGVWVGNSDGRGQRGMSGVRSAAPILFRLFNLLPRGAWFSRPENDMMQVEICPTSGLPRGTYCPKGTYQWVPHRATHPDACTYHKEWILDSTGSYRVHGTCYPLEHTLRKVGFVLPAVPAWYYRRAHPEYTPLPPWYPGCLPAGVEPSLAFLYPVKQGALVSTPRGKEGKVQPIPFRVTYAQPTASIYWHLDGQYVGTTCGEHCLHLTPSEGLHELVVVGPNHEENKIWFRVIYAGEEQKESTTRIIK